MRPADPASWRPASPSRSPRRAISRSPIRPASPSRACTSSRDPALAYDYTAKGNMVAVVSNGTAVLGLGNLGALAAQAGDGGQDRAVQALRRHRRHRSLRSTTEDVDESSNCVRYLGPSFGGINLEDIKAPECFVIEQRLRELMDIPVFHDDQHGTAIVAAAGLINACHLTGRDLRDNEAGGERRRRRRPSPASNC